VTAVDPLSSPTPTTREAVGKEPIAPVPEPDGWFEKSASMSTYVDADGSKQTLYALWYPLFDVPITIRTSRESLQAIADELRGVNVYPGWAEHMAKRLDVILRRSMDEPSAALAVPAGKAEAPDARAWIDQNYPEIEYHGIHEGMYRWGDDPDVDERNGIRSALEDMAAALASPAVQGEPDETVDFYGLTIAKDMLPLAERALKLHGGSGAVQGVTAKRECRTREEVTALPDGSVILDVHGDVWQRRGNHWSSYESAPVLIDGFRRQWLPAEVLHVGLPVEADKAEEVAHYFKRGADQAYCGRASRKIKIGYDDWSKVTCPACLAHPVAPKQFEADKGDGR
jgi:hypothetical protein